MAPEPVTYYTPEDARRIVAANGLSQEAVAKVLGSSVYSVGGWMNGRHSPGPSFSGNYQRLLSLLARREELLDGTLRRRIESLLVAVGKEVAA